VVNICRPIVQILEGRTRPKQRVPFYVCIAVVGNTAIKTPLNDVLLAFPATTVVLFEQQTRPRTREGLRRHVPLKLPNGTPIGYFTGYPRHLLVDLRGRVRTFAPHNGWRAFVVFGHASILVVVSPSGGDFALKVGPVRG